MIKNRYLEIDYNGRLPMIIFSDAGWEIEREYYSDELLNGFYNMLETKDTSLLSDKVRKEIQTIILALHKNSCYIVDKINYKAKSRKIFYILIPLNILS